LISQFVCCNVCQDTVKVPDITIDPSRLNKYRLSADIVRQKIPGLPEMLEWWEADTFLVCVVNYESEEGQICDPCTHFTIIVHGKEETNIKHTMLTSKVEIHITQIDVLILQRLFPRRSFNG